MLKKRGSFPIFIQVCNVHKLLIGLVQNSLQVTFLQLHLLFPLFFLQFNLNTCIGASYINGGQFKVFVLILLLLPCLPITKTRLRKAKLHYQYATHTFTAGDTLSESICIFVVICRHCDPLNIPFKVAPRPWASCSEQI